MKLLAQSECGRDVTYHRVNQLHVDISVRDAFDDGRTKGRREVRQTISMLTSGI